ncbi:MAG: tripartite tricarboxylate transporter substrate-binding protein [Pseudomonadota bacterium]
MASFLDTKRNDICFRIQLWLVAILALGACDQDQQPQATSCSAFEIVVGFGVGGGTDLFARTLSKALQDDVGVPVQIVNITAGSGVAAFRDVLRRPKDGCSLLALTTDYIVLASVQPQDVDLSQLRFLTRAHAELGLLSAKSDLDGGWNAILARARNEDRPLLVGGVGARSFDRAVVNLALKNAPASIRFRYIPYSGAKEMQADLLGGRLDLIYDEYGVMKPLLDAGKAKAVVFFYNEPLDVLPGVPTTTDLGLTTPPPIWRGLGMHKNVPDPIAIKLESAILEALNSPAYKVYEQNRRLDLIDGRLDGAAFTAAIDEELIQFKAVLGQ